MVRTHTHTSWVTVLIDALYVLEQSQSLLTRDLSHLSEHCGQIHLSSALHYYWRWLCTNTCRRYSVSRAIVANCFIRQTDAFVSPLIASESETKDAKLYLCSFFVLRVCITGHTDVDGRGFYSYCCSASTSISEHCSQMSAMRAVSQNWERPDWLNGCLILNTRSMIQEIGATMSLSAGQKDELKAVLYHWMSFSNAASQSIRPHRLCYRTNLLCHGLVSLRLSIMLPSPKYSLQ